MVCRLQLSEKQSIEEGRALHLQFRSRRIGQSLQVAGWKQSKKEGRVYRFQLRSCLQKRAGFVGCRLEAVYKRGQGL